MPTTVSLPDGYGFTVLIALGVVPVLSFGHGIVVGMERKTAKLPYPNPYATPEQVKNSKEAYRFNCAQRAHANLLENMPQTIAMLLFAGAFYPVATPVLGLVWVVSRILFMYGYINSDKPNGSGRMLGSSFWLAQLGLIGLSASAGLKLI